MSTVQDQFRKALAAKLAQKQQQQQGNTGATNTTSMEALEPPVAAPTDVTEAEEEIKCPSCGEVVDELVQDPLKRFSEGVCNECSTKLEKEKAKDTPSPLDSVPDKICPQCNKPQFYKTKKGEVKSHRHYLIDGRVGQSEDEEDEQDMIDLARANDIIDPSMIQEYKPAYGMVQISHWPNSWKTLVQAMNTVVTEATVKISKEDGLTFRSMDPSHVALVDAEIPESAFDKFDIPENIKFTFLVEDVLPQLIKLAQDKEAKEDVLRITVKDEMITHMSFTGKQFSRHLIDSTYGDTPLPKLHYDGKFVVETKEWIKMLKNLADSGDHVTMNLNRAESSISFSNKSDKGDGSEKWDRSKPFLVSIEGKEDKIEAIYSIDYLLNIANACKTSDYVAVEFSSKMPLKATFSCGEYGRITFFLAPRIEG